MTNGASYRFVRRLLQRSLPPSVYGKVTGSISPILRQVQHIKLALLRTFIRRYKYPRIVYIFLTTRCNLRCFICRRENFKSEELEFNNILKLEKAIRYADTIDLTGWGECLIYPNSSKYFSIYTL